MKKISGIGIALCLLVIAGVIGRNVIADGGTYYTQVDNAKMEEINTENGVVNFEGSLPYRYTLPCYNQTGKEKELSFTAGKELREWIVQKHAFLQDCCLPAIPSDTIDIVGYTIKHSDYQALFKNKVHK